MALSVAVQMDPIERINIAADSTFRIMEEAQARGHRLFYYTPDRLGLDEGRVVARGWPVEVRRVKGDHFTLGPEQEVDLADWDVVWLRQDPPFDMGYITTTHMLDRIHPDTLVVNDPFWVRNFPEKLLVLTFPDLTPPTTVARDLATLKAFKARHGDIILKPLYGNGGAGVFRLDPNDRNFNALYELFTGINREPLIAQKFLPDVSPGDKRVILVDGEAVGAINRVPQAGETRSNMHVGGRPEPAALTERDREICARIGPALREKGQIFVGHRRDRQLADRDQRDLAHRHPGTGALRRRERHREDLGGDRAAPTRRMSWQLAVLNLYLRLVERPSRPRDRFRPLPRPHGDAGAPLADAPRRALHQRNRSAASLPCGFWRSRIPRPGRRWSSGCTAGPIASARRPPMRRWWPHSLAASAPAPSCPTTGWRRSTRFRRPPRTRWRLRRPAGRGVAPGRIVLGGDSAGGASPSRCCTWRWPRGCRCRPRPSPSAPGPT